VAAVVRSLWLKEKAASELFEQTVDELTWTRAMALAEIRKQ
jgi:hypothetical protein